MSATDPHLGDEALSAFLDGEATPSEAAHVASCASCRERAATLAAAARAITAAPAPIDPARRDAAIATAVAARVVPITSRRFRPPVWAVGAAAAALLAAVLIPSLVNRDAGDRQDTAASDTANKASPTPEAGAELRAPAAAVVDAGDLGPLDADGLQPRVAAALQPSATAAGSAASGEGSGGAAGSSAPGAATASRTSVCAQPVAGTDSDLGPLRLVGRATVRGRAAEVLAYADATGDKLRVFVVALDDCADILLYARFDLPR